MKVGSSAWLWVSCALSCGFPRPYTSGDLQRDAPERAGAALLHYLTQSGADPALCIDEVVLAGFTTSDFETFADGLERVDAERWTACAHRLLSGLHGAVSDGAIAELAKRFVENLDASNAHLDALARVLDTRPSESRISSEAIRELADALAGELGPQARAIAAHVYEGFEMSRGRYRGAPVSEPVLASLDVDTLQRLARLLPTPSERRAARMRYVELTVAKSPSSYVRSHAEQTRARVLATGRNALDLTKAAIKGASYTEAASPDSALAELNVEAQTTRLLLRTKGEAALLPALDLKEILRFEVNGVDSPITLCGPATALDVVPCIDAAAVEVGSPIAVLDDEGGLHMRDNLSASELGDLLARDAQLTVPVLLGVKPLAKFRWPLRVLPPEPVLYDQGQPLSATVERLGSSVALTFAVPGAAPWQAFVEASDVDAFSITTRGTQGMWGHDGSTGSSGMPGSSGSSASCPSSPGQNGVDGGDGGNGGNGGNGGPGGPGGDVDLSIVCRADCAELEQLARRLVRTEGGPGGPGGRGGAGGRGGSGGSGGSGTTCSSMGSTASTHLSSGNRGRDGRDGSSGWSGQSGPPGMPGRVSVRVLPR